MPTKKSPPAPLPAASTHDACHCDQPLNLIRITSNITTLDASEIWQSPVEIIFVEPRRTSTGINWLASHDFWSINRILQYIRISPWLDLSKPPLPSISQSTWTTRLGHLRAVNLLLSGTRNRLTKRLSPHIRIGWTLLAPLDHGVSVG